MPPKANEFRTLQLIHKAMALGMLLLTVIMIFAVAKRGQPLADASFERTLQVVALLVSAGCTYVGITIFKKKLQAIPPMDTAKDRMAAYREAALLRWVLIEVPVLMSVIFLWLTSNYAFLALAIALMFIFAAVRPSTDVIAYQLRLTEAELKELQGLSE